MYYDLWGLRPPPCPSFYMVKGVWFTRKIQVSYNLSDQESISTCLFYKIYLLNDLGNRLPFLDLQAEWDNSWWAHLSFSLSLVSWVPMVPNLINMDLC
jgi:hypothetical protein